MKKTYGTYRTPQERRCMYHWSLRRRRAGDRVKSLFKEIIAENFPNLGRDLDIQLHEANSSPQNLNPKRSLPRQIIKLSKIRNKE